MGSQSLNSLVLLSLYIPRNSDSPPHLHDFFAPSTTNPKKSSCFFNTTNSLIKRRRPNAISARLDNSQQPKQQQQQLNLSVLRFTLGIPGLDESYLPRWIGFTFGSLILLNHFVGSGPATSAQLRSEVLGVCLAAFSMSLPFIGKFLKGENPVDRSALPEGSKQLFVMQENLSDTQKEDLAWGSYVLLRNTNTMSVLIWVQNAVCVRGYWNTPEDASKAHIRDWIMRQIQQFGFSDLKEALYFPQISDPQVWEMLPNGVLSVLVQPVLGAPNPGALDANKIDGFILLASSSSYAYGDRDRAWIRAVASKFKGAELAL